MTDAAPPSPLNLEEPQPISIDKALDVLSNGTIELQGLLPWSSNYTFLVTVHLADIRMAAVYKPCQGERPLWDFPRGTLANREVAAYQVSASLGWTIVPPTVLRGGPHGPGMVQLYVEADPSEHYFTFGSRFPGSCRRIAVFDILVNNADRKAGHCLRGAFDHIWAIDHGICFHEEPKLRTVIWEFAGEPISDELLDDLRGFRERIGLRSEPITQSLHRLLTKEEVTALRRRAERLIVRGRFPDPGPSRHIPWPPV